MEVGLADSIQGAEAADLADSAEAIRVAAGRPVIGRPVQYNA